MISGTGLGTVRDVQALAVLGLLEVHVEILEDLLCGVTHRDLVHQEAAEPEAAPEVVVLFDDHYLDAALGEFLRRGQPRGAAADDDDVGVRKVHELFGPLLSDRAGDVGFAT